MITINSKTYQIVSFTPVYESGIEWKQVGKTLHAIDYGEMSDHYNTTLIVSGTYADIIDLYDYLRSQFAVSNISTSTDVAIYGPHITATTGKITNIDKPVQQFVNIATLEFSLNAVSYTYAYSAIPISLTSDIVTKITRDLDSGKQVHTKEFGSNVSTIADPIETSTITLLTSKERTGQLLRSFISNVRSNSQMVTVNNCWLFEEGVYTYVIKVLAISNIRPFDLAQTRWTWDLTLVRE